MADFLDEKKREIDARLKELRPLVEEFHRLEAAAAALDGVAGGGGRAATAARHALERGGGRFEAVELFHQGAQLLQARVDLTFLLIKEVGHPLTTHQSAIFVNFCEKFVSGARRAP